MESYLFSKGLAEVEVFFFLHIEFYLLLFTFSLRDITHQHSIREFDMELVFSGTSLCEGLYTRIL